MRDGVYKSKLNGSFLGMPLYATDGVNTLAITIGIYMGIISPQKKNFLYAQKRIRKKNLQSIKI